MKLARLTPKHLKKFRCAGLRGGCFAPRAAALRRTLAVTITPVPFASAQSLPREHPPTALRRTLAVTITPVTFASAVAAPGDPGVHLEGKRV